MAKKKNVEAEVRRLNDRVSGAESVNRLIFKVQMGQLAKAEQLRKLALAATHPKPPAGALQRLRWFVEDLTEFHRHPLAGIRRNRK
jgi:hypothetical protein